MIHSNNGTTNMHGDIVSLISDLTYILMGVREILVDNFSETDSDEIVDYCLRMSRMSDDDLEKEAQKIEHDFAEKVRDLTNDL